MFEKNAAFWLWPVHQLALNTGLIVLKIHPKTRRWNKIDKNHPEAYVKLS